MQNKNQKIGIVCCSNGQSNSQKERLERLECILSNIGYQPVYSDCIYEIDGVASGSAKKRAEALMNFYRDEDVIDIFDISGGDIANGILPYLDYEYIANSNKVFWGYSDVTTVINAIYAKAGKASVLYQIRNVMYGENQLDNFIHRKNLFDFSYQFVQGSHMKGIVVGGNIRCFLKLAGTSYMPDLTDKILLLESRSGTVAQMETFLSQLEQIGAFDKISGILLGTFTQMQKEKCTPTIENLILKYVREDVPVAVTKEIGHGTDSKAIVVGGEYQFYN